MEWNKSGREKWDGPQAVNKSNGTQARERNGLGQKEVDRNGLAKRSGLEQKWKAEMGLRASRKQKWDGVYVGARNASEHYS